MTTYSFSGTLATVTSLHAHATAVATSGLTFTLTNDADDFQYFYDSGNPNPLQILGLLPDKYLNLRIDGQLIADSEMSFGVFSWGAGKQTTVMFHDSLADFGLWVLAGDALPSFTNLASFNFWRTSISATDPVTVPEFGPIFDPVNFPGMEGGFLVSAPDSLVGIVEDDLFVVPSVVIYTNYPTAGYLMGAGNDTATGGLSFDVIYGGDGNDVLSDLAGQVMSGGDGLYGDAGNDTLRGEFGWDGLFGGDDNDRLYGGAGNDDLVGGNGKDRIFGGIDMDRMSGDAGGDFLDGGKGRDDLAGGLGADVFSFSAQMSRDVVRDFSVADGDIAQIAASLVGGNAAMTGAQVIAQFGRAVSGGSVLDFGGGDVIFLLGVTNLAALQAQIEVI